MMVMEVLETIGKKAMDTIKVKARDISIMAEMVTTIMATEEMAITMEVMAITTKEMGRKATTTMQTTGISVRFSASDARRWDTTLTNVQRRRLQKEPNQTRSRKQLQIM